MGFKIYHNPLDQVMRFSFWPEEYAVPPGDEVVLHDRHAVLVKKRGLLLKAGPSPKPNARQIEPEEMRRARNALRGVVRKRDGMFELMSGKAGIDALEDAGVDDAAQDDDGFARSAPPRSARRPAVPSRARAVATTADDEDVTSAADAGMVADDGDDDGIEDGADDPSGAVDDQIAELRRQGAIKRDAAQARRAAPPPKPSAADVAAAKADATTPPAAAKSDASGGKPTKN